MKGIEADLGLRDGGLDGLLVAGRHVDRDRLDRPPAVAEFVEERLQGGGVATGLGPHDRAAAVVGDAGQVALPLAVGDLVDADRDEAREALFVEVIGDHALNDPTDRLPADPEQRGDRRLGHLLGEERDQVLEAARVARTRSGPRDGLEPGTAVAAPHPPQAALDRAAAGAEVEMPPALESPVVEVAADLAAT